MFEYKIHVRPLNQTDASKDCPFPIIDDYTHTLHLNALIEDIANLPDITSARSSDGNILINSTLLDSELKNKMQHLFSREFCYVKFTKIENMKN